MRIVLTEITRLHSGYCCIAGICPENGRLYRLSDPRVKRTDVDSNNWHVGTILEGDFIQQSKDNVHAEDSFWNAKSLGMTAPSSYLYGFFENTCTPSLEGFLGITDRGTPVDCIRPTGFSIATLYPATFCIRLVVWDNKPKIRASLSLASGITCVDTSDLPVNDIRFFKSDDTVDVTAVQCAQEHINRMSMGFERLFVRVGLTRPFIDKRDGVSRYWLQVDGLHFFQKSDGEYVREFR